MSGYGDKAGLGEKGVVLLQKPLTPAMLAGKLREVLDGTVPQG